MMTASRAGDAGAPDRLRSRPPASPQAQQPLRGLLRVRLLTALCSAFAGLLVVVLLAHVPAVVPGRELPVLVLAGLFALAEILVVHVPFRHEAHSVSLSEVAIVIGLFYFPPMHLLAAQIIGATVALTVHRRQQPVKLAFNIALFSIALCLAIVVFRALDPAGDAFSAWGWVATIAATATMSMVTAFGISAAISLSDGRLSLDEWLPVLAFSLGVTAVNTSLGIVTVTIMWFAPLTAALLAVPAVALFAAYRAYVSASVNHQRVDFLYRSGRMLIASTRSDTAVRDLMHTALVMFRVGVTRIVLLPGTDSQPGRRAVLREGGDGEITEAAELPPVETALAKRVAAEGTMIVRRGGCDAEMGAYLDGAGVRDAIVTPLTMDGEVIGTMLVGNRVGDVTSFSDADAWLLETLAGQVAAALATWRLETSLKHQAFHDPLTGLPNRRLFHETAAAALAGTDEVAIVLIDLDDFKVVNDTLGHAAGDELLRGVADRLVACLGRDTTPARLGGDEFAVLIERDGPDDAGVQLASCIHSALRSPMTIGVEQVTVRASIGIATTVTGSRHIDELLRQADMAMYVAKTEGKARSALFERGMQDAMRRRHLLKADLEQAIERGQLSVHYQPVVSLDTGRMTGVEALVRWEHPVHGSVSPAEFITLAEGSGAIVEIGQWVLDTACRQMHTWHRQHPRDRRLELAVNLSAQQLSHPSLTASVADTLRSSQLVPACLTFEITESLVMTDMRQSVARLQELKAMGIRLALDDFGTGHSSLSCVRDLPIDVLKIDRSFVSGLRPEVPPSPFLSAISHLARALDLDVVAEGVELAEQVAGLRRLGCSRVQGFYYGHPMPADALTRLLEAESRRTAVLGDGLEQMLEEVWRAGARPRTAVAEAAVGHG